MSICKTIGPLVFDYTCTFLKCIRFIINMNKRFKMLTHAGDKPENFDCTLLGLFMPYVNCLHLLEILSEI